MGTNTQFYGRIKIRIQTNIDKGAATTFALAPKTETALAVVVEPRNFMPGAAWQLKPASCFSSRIRTKRAFISDF